MAHAEDVLTLDEAKTALNLTGTAKHDAELPAWVTAVSRRLDRAVGPIVRREVTEVLSGGGDVIHTRLYPVSSYTSVTEYSDTTGTVLTVETNLSKPNAAYLPYPYSGNPTLFNGRLRRRGGGSDVRFTSGDSNVAVVYVAGRFATTGAVDEIYKTAARIMLQNLWSAQSPNVAQVDEFEIPQQRFPRFAIPNAVKELLADEWQEGPLVG